MLHVITGLIFLPHLPAGPDVPAGPKARPVRPAARPRWEWLVLVIPALALGYTRYIGSDAVPDSRLGIVRIVDGCRRCEWTHNCPTPAAYASARHSRSRPTCNFD